MPFSTNSIQKNTKHFIQLKASATRQKNSITEVNNFKFFFQEDKLLSIKRCKEGTKQNQKKIEFRETKMFPYPTRVRENKSEVSLVV